MTRAGLLLAAFVTLGGPAGAEPGKPAILALRLAIVEGEITEAETLVARSDEGARQVEALGKPHPLYSSAVAPPLSRDALVRTAAGSSSRPASSAS
jgi:hypothetical protein